MDTVLRVWATEMGLEIRGDGLYRDGTRVFYADTDDENRAFLRGYEQQLPEGKRQSVMERVNKTALRRRAYDRMWGTYVYLTTADDFWLTAKLAIEYEQEFGENVHPIEMHVSFGLYMGNQFQVLLHVVVDEPSPARTAMLKAMEEHFHGKGVVKLDDKGDVDFEILLRLWRWRDEPRLKPSYTPEILAGLRKKVEAGLEPTWFRLDAAGELQPDFQAMKNDCSRNGFEKVAYGYDRMDCY